MTLGDLMKLPFFRYLWMVAMSDEKKVWIIFDGCKYGPYAEASVSKWLGEGKLTSDCLGWFSGMQGWRPLSEVVGTGGAKDVIGGASGHKASVQSPESAAFVKTGSRKVFLSKSHGAVLIGAICVFFLLVFSVMKVRVGDNSAAGSSVRKSLEKASSYIKVGNYDAARRLVKNLAARGNAEAEYDMGQIGFPTNFDAASSDLDKAVLWYRRAAMGGNAHAQWFMGQLYYDGQDHYENSVAKNYAKALSWFKRSFLSGNVDAALSIGMIYSNGGPGVDQDCDKALNWYKRIENSNADDATKGDAESIVGAMYFTGKCIPRNYDKAGYWIQKAVAHGDATDQPLLSIIHQ